MDLLTAGGGIGGKFANNFFQNIFQRGDTLNITYILILAAIANSPACHGGANKDGNWRDGGEN